MWSTEANERRRAPVTQAQRVSQLQPGSGNTTQRAWPGALGAVGTALLSGLACWVWLLPLVAANLGPSAAGANLSFQLSEVADAELSDALSTMDIPAATAAQIWADPRNCKLRLAWVSLLAGPGGEPQTVRLRSGRYFSPRIPLPQTPVRVAIPYPAPYESGRGELMVLGVTTGITVALTPPWHIPAKAVSAAHPVRWTPNASCRRP